MFFRSVAAALCVLTGAVTAPAQESPNTTFTIPVFAHRVTWHTVPGNWHQSSVMPLLRDNPAGGYASVNPAIISAINEQMTANGISPMVSWWPQDWLGGNDFLDAYLPIPGPKIALLYEATGRLKTNKDLHGPSGNQSTDVRYDFSVPANADRFVADMVYLHRTYFTGPYADRFTRIDGRPVVFIWITHAFDGPFDKVMARVREQVPVYLIGSEFSVPFHARRGIETIIPAMDAVSSYGFYWPDQHGPNMSDAFVAEYTRALGTWSAWLSVRAPHVKILSPLIFNYDETLIPGRRGINFRSTPAVARRLAQAARTAIADPCTTRVLPMAYVTSYDECYEGTCVITSEEYGSTYLDILRETFTPPVTITPEQRNNCRR